MALCDTVFYSHTIFTCPLYNFFETLPTKLLEEIHGYEEEISAKRTLYYCRIFLKITENVQGRGRFTTVDWRRGSNLRTRGWSAFDIPDKLILKKEKKKENGVGRVKPAGFKNPGGSGPVSKKCLAGRVLGHARPSPLPFIVMHAGLLKSKIREEGLCIN
ncbi:hypothetical protein ACS0TY_022988 [Phlomoides rotata]